MKKYKYELVTIPQNVTNSIVNQFEQLGYDGYELITVDHGIAYFKKEINIQDREIDDIPVAPTPVMVEPQKENEPELRPVSEKDYIIQLLYKHGFNRIVVANEMGISVRTLYRKMEHYALTEQFKNEKVSHRSKYRKDV